MKKILYIFLAVTLFCACQRDKVNDDVVTVKIVNLSTKTLVFSNMENGGDFRFYPESTITLMSGETYSRTQNNIGNYDPIIIAPVAITIECDGKGISVDSKDDLERNPCRIENWNRYSNKSKYGPGVFFDFVISDSDLEKWFGVQ